MNYYFLHYHPYLKAVLGRGSGKVPFDLNTAFSDLGSSSRKGKIGCIVYAIEIGSLGPSVPVGIYKHVDQPCKPVLL